MDSQVSEIFLTRNLAKGKIMAHELIAHQEIGNTFSCTYYVQSSHIKKTTTNKDYTDMMLRDKSGTRPVKFWGTVKDLSKGCFVFVAASVEEYQGNPSIIARNIEIVDEPDSLDDYLPIYDGVSELVDDFYKLTEEILLLEKKTNDSTCRLLIDEVYKQGSFFDRFIKNPGSDGPHYGKVGGLLANVIRITGHSFNICKLYNLEDNENAVILTAALLCRVGCADAYEFEDCMPVMTKRGQLIGVHNLTMNRISSAIRRVIQIAKKENKIFSEEIILRVLHAVVASQKSSMVKAMTKEAIILQGVIGLDSEVSDALDFMDNDKNDGEEFTGFDPRLGRRYYRG